MDELKEHITLASYLIPLEIFASNSREKITSIDRDMGK